MQRARNPNFGRASSPTRTDSVLQEAAANGKVVLTSRHLTCFPAGILTVGASKEEWWLVEAVKHLDLSFNPQLRRVPPDICQLAASLTVLKLRACGLSSLPPELCALAALATRRDSLQHRR